MVIVKVVSFPVAHKEASVLRRSSEMSQSASLKNVEKLRDYWPTMNNHLGLSSVIDLDCIYYCSRCVCVCVVVCVVVHACVCM